MIRSMTGYGRSDAAVADKVFSFEIKGVNHRYLDIRLHAPREYYYLEEILKKQVAKRISRGRVDIYLRYDIVGEPDTEIVCNYELAQSYVDSLQSLKDRLNLHDEIPLELIASQPDVLIVKNKEIDTGLVETALLRGFEEAVKAFLAMKEIEGRELANDFEEKLSCITSILSLIKERSPTVIKEYQEKLNARIAELIQDVALDGDRLALEVSIFADKSSIDEELIRLNSHILQFNEILDKGDVVGRKLDFLSQELNREINTIGSKANDYLISKYVVECKAILEKIREQVQNIE